MSRLEYRVDILDILSLKFGMVFNRSLKSFDIRIYCS